MAVIIGNGTIETSTGNSGKFVIKNLAGTEVFKQAIELYGGSSYGYMSDSTRPMFQAYSSTDPGWVSLATGNWHKVNNYMTSTIFNRGSHYNTSTTRFTAPINGQYMFIVSHYCNRPDYIHPEFTVNGDLTLRRGAAWKARIRGHGNAANYEVDGHIFEVINLIAGDYVECYMYASGVCTHYARHGMFSGAFIG